MKNKIALLSLALVGFNAVSIPLTPPALAFDQLLIQQFGIANITDNGNSGISKENISLPSLLGDRTVKIAQALSLRVQTKSIIAFNQLQGNTAWQQDIRNRILSSQWDFYSNGTFSFGITEAKNQQQLDLKLNLSYGFNSASNTQDTNNLSSSLVLNREFGNLSQDNAVIKSEISLRNANYTLAKTQDNLNEELKNKTRNVKDTFKQIELAQQARKLAASKVINAKERMRLSSNISMTDIINFEKSLVDAQNQELNAIINHLNSVTQLEQFLGITLGKWVK
ncbi:TolC family protein [Cuspidothrix issatschenkoi LEGE 03284]|uniref:TolC family protein n=1 Tax=Cuspidothrix issatschenkoi TaxID=230752 RepID=UPI001882B009|nr:TolC family protein [Cuspidothrix issatschenkoi]MBE9233850.1 TolC family protein [Cuspidothrix issatschenkoi LEGE 03284]